MKNITRVLIVLSLFLSPLYLYAGQVGINVNFSGSKSRPVLIPALQDMNIRSVRLYTSISKGCDASTNDKFADAIKFKSEGFTVLMTIVNDKGSGIDPVKLKSCLGKTMDDTALRSAVDIWEIGNEVDNNAFWPGGDISSYVSTFLKPAYEVLHASGEKVAIAPMTTGSLSKFHDAMNKYGGKNYTDYSNYHVYGTTISQFKANLDAYTSSAATYGKPLLVTEWNAGPICTSGSPVSGAAVRCPSGYNDTAWISNLKQSYDYISNSSVVLSYYYTSGRDDSKLHGHAGIFNTDCNCSSGTQLTTKFLPYYNTFLGFAGKAGTTDDTGGTGGSGGTGTTGGGSDTGGGTGTTGGGTTGGGGATGGGTTGGGGGISGSGGITTCQKDANGNCINPGSVVPGAGGVGTTPTVTSNPCTDISNVNCDSSTGGGINSGTITTDPTPANTGITPVKDIPTDGLVPCGNEADANTAANSCQFKQLVELGKKIINFLFFAAVLMTVCLLVYTGFLYMSAGSNPAQLGVVKKKFRTIGIGFLFVLGAWLIVNTLVSVLVNTTVIPNPLTQTTTNNQ